MTQPKIESLSAKASALLALSPIALATPLAAQDGTTVNDQTAPQDLTFERVFASPSLNGPGPRAANAPPYSETSCMEYSDITPVIEDGIVRAYALTSQGQLTPGR